MFIGGIAENFESSYRVGGGRDFVIEGDEYDSAFFDKTAKFLKYLPDIAVVNNIEFDHADIYPDLDAIRLAFQRFVNLVPRRGLLLLGADNAEALALASARSCRVETFGLSDGADWQAHDLQRAAGPRRRSASGATASRSASFELPLLGAYNVRNALAAIAVGAAVGLNTDTMADGAAAVQGRAPPAGAPRHGRRASRSTTTSPTIRPRSRRRWRASGPRFPNRRIWAIFEPRSATSCRRIFQADFARALAGADTSSCRRCFVRPCRRISASLPSSSCADLKAAEVDARYIPQVDDIVRDGRRRERGRAIWSSSCPTAASTTSTRSC